MSAVNYNPAGKGAVLAECASASKLSLYFHKAPIADTLLP